MFQVLLAVHLIICLALIGAILLQRSEGGGALGIGGGGPGNLMSGRSASSLIVRATQILGAAFFATSLGLTLLAANGQQPAGSVIEQGVDADGDGLPDRIDLGPSAPAGGAAAPAPAAPASQGGIPASAPTAPVPAAPAAPAPAEPAQ
jgi:preprotein translocase subunit SecG